MSRKFNITGCCYPDRHYMVDLTSRLKEIEILIDEGEYFIINRARQYGKTTTLQRLKDYLSHKYIVISMDFQKFSTASFESETAFVRRYAEELLGMTKSRRKKLEGFSDTELSAFENALDKRLTLPDLFTLLSNLCETAEKPVVLMIDEVDRASDNQIFLDFLGQLRYAYLNKEDIYIFHSVILAGVYDIKNMKKKIRPQEEQRYNSPWNIAADFRVDMSFGVEDIVQMLSQYENDRHIGMEVEEIAQLIYDYTSGYPYLVSYICKLLDEDWQAAKWTKEGVTEAVKVIVKESNVLYDDMIKHVLEYPELYKMLYNILFKGEHYPYQVYDQSVDIGRMFGFIIDKEGEVAVANRIFETQLYNYFIVEALKQNDRQRELIPEKSQFIENGVLDMDKVMHKFFEYYTSLIDRDDADFVENQGRKLFLMFLRPIINGVGNYYVEDQSRSRHRTDIVVDYKGKQYIIELKIWRGEEYQHRGRLQPADYLEAYHQEKGYLLSFNLNKMKKQGITEMVIDGKTIVEVVV